MNEQFFVKRGAFGGVLTLILANITSGELIKTALVAAVGSLVSIIVSVICRRIFKDPSQNNPGNKQ